MYEEQERVINALKAEISQLTAQEWRLANEHKIRGLQWELEGWNEARDKISAQRLDANDCIKRLEEDTLRMSRFTAERLLQCYEARGLWQSKELSDGTDGDRFHVAFTSAHKT